MYIATAEARDAEMAAKIAAHRAGRAGARWRTLEAPIDLVPTIEGIEEGEAALLDCATLWLANLQGAGRDWRRALGALEGALARARGPVVIVSNEIGMGGIAADAATRAFQRDHGEMNRALARVAGFAALVVAGRPLVLAGDAADLPGPGPAR